jgi:(2R)-3-sulfolactate dehydrogenase (NADP+)
LIRSDARGGVAQLGFDLAFDELCRRCAAHGVAIFSQSNSFTAGELGDYVRRLADAGLVALAATNGPALMTVPGGKAPVFCTNPIAFAAPVGRGAPLVIDQATSATAFVNIRERAARGEELPPGWAIDANGVETTDANAAMNGALLTFGGWRGANIALMVEILAAGLTGANWSLDAPSFTEGVGPPGVGLFVIAIEPKPMTPGFAGRLEAQMQRLAENGLYIPGRSGTHSDNRPQTIELPLSLVEQIGEYRSRTPDETA